MILIRKGFREALLKYIIIFYRLKELMSVRVSLFVPKLKKAAEKQIAFFVSVKIVC